jgi:hypothetical protein
MNFDNKRQLPDSAHGAPYGAFYAQAAGTVKQHDNMHVDGESRVVRARGGDSKKSEIRWWMGTVREFD